MNGTNYSSGTCLSQYLLQKSISSKDMHTPRSEHKRVGLEIRSMCEELELAK